MKMLEVAVKTTQVLQLGGWERTTMKVEFSRTDKYIHITVKCYSNFSIKFRITYDFLSKITIMS